MYHMKFIAKNIEKRIEVAYSKSNRCQSRVEKIVERKLMILFEPRVCNCPTINLFISTLSPRIGKDRYTSCISLYAIV